MRQSENPLTPDYLASLVRQIMALPPEPKAIPVEHLPLEPEEVDVLDYVMERESCLACEICEHLQLSTGYVWGVLVKLRTKGYIGSHTPPAKRKARAWYITDKGKRAAITPQRWAVS